ncbi:MAG: BatD family protein [Candidatus Firestonebacteria bacterium]
MRAVILLILLTNIIFGEDVSITASVDKNQVEVNDEILLQVTVSGNASSLPNLVSPEMSDFNVYSRGQNQSQNFSFVNGRISSAVSIVYNYTLTPKGVGKFAIPSFSIEYKGKTYKTNHINIEVVKSSTQKQTGTIRKTNITSKEDVFISVTLNKNKVYVNEPVIMSFRLYTRIGFLQQPQYKPPETTGFWIEDLPPQRNFKEIANGLEYMITEIKTALFPLSPGEYTIGQAYVNCVINDSSSDDFSDNFFRGIFSRGKNISLESKSMSINVLPLPSVGKPSNFSGTVGVFNIKAQVDKKELKTNDPVTLTITISGLGNIKSVTEPVVSIDENEFKKYETVSSLNINKDNYEVSGSKVFKTVIVPRKSGKSTIPSVRYSFFDYIEKKYKISSSSPMEFLVKQGTKEETPRQVVALSPEGVKILGKDIRYIKQKIAFERPLLYKNLVFVIIILSLPIGLLMAWPVRQFNKRRKKDEIGLRASRAYAKAMKGLKNIYKLINTNKPDENYAALENVLTEYIADKIGKESAGLTKEEIKQSLLKKAEESLINDTNGLIEQIHFVRFAPSRNTQTNLTKLTESIQETISKLERVL